MPAFSVFRGLLSSLGGGYDARRLLEPDMNIYPFRRAFTLVELLVVMAIIMVLAAIALPALFAAKNQSYVADCTSNLNNLGKALTQFSTTLNQNLPGPDGVTPTVVFSGSASNLIAQLVDFGMETNSQAWYCKRHMKYANLDRKTESSARRISYFYWGWTAPSGSTAAVRIDMFSTNSAWRDFGYSSNKAKATVLMSDPFRDAARSLGPPPSGTSDVQFHSGSKFDIPLTDPGSLVLLSGGAVQKLGPKQP